MADIQSIGVTSGIPTSGTGDVPTLSAFLSRGSVSQTFTPAATSHTALDSVGGSRTFSNVGWSGKLIEIVEVKFTAPTTTPIATAFKLWLYSAAIGTPISDDGAFAPVTADESLFLGVIDIPTPLDPGSTLQTITVPGSWFVQLSGTDLIGYLQNLTTFTFEAIAHTIRLVGIPRS